MPENKKNNLYFDIKKKKPTTPSLQEIKKNPSSRSAKLRYGIKIKNNCEFVELKKKFKYLLDLEQLGSNL